MAKIDFRAGAAIRGQVRSILLGYEMEYPNIQWRESKGFLNSWFVVTGPEGGLASIIQDLRSRFRETK